MIIDFHVHTFPEKVAVKALSKLSKSANIMPYTDGTLDCLLHSMKENSISHSVILPVATSPTQYKTINMTAAQINEKYHDQGIISFGSLHPDNDNYKDIINSLAKDGIKGIKLHPVFQGVYLDDIRYMRIIEYACEKNMIVMVHGGMDISFPGKDYAVPSHIIPVVKKLKPDKMILAHMGAWDCWDELIPFLSECHIMLDTSFTMTPARRKNAAGEVVSVDAPLLSKEKFLKIARLAGIENVFFGSDSPWTMQKESIQSIKDSGLSIEEQEFVFYRNAARLLKIDI